MMALTTFRCPKCGATWVALASAQIAHRCPRNRNHMTDYIRDDKEKD